MRSERYARLKAGILAGLLASLMLGFALWLFGYITGYRLAVAWLSVAAAGVGLIAGAQVYISNPEDPAPPDQFVAELEQLSQAKALRDGNLAAKSKRSGKTS
jgi:hypothetical protein